ncbi:MAG TPA: hypothetical protein PKO06_24060, partial [Candidatus Ozemobacteraceae bacterium]|nr:hypothetical protein [Candidatus Ozemobacteraceae bacterium]
MRPITSVHHRFGSGYVGTWHKPSPSRDPLAKTPGALLALYHINELPLRAIERFARRRANPGFKREIRFEPIAPLPRFLSGEHDLTLVTSLVDTDFAQQYHRTHRAKMLQGLQPVLIVHGKKHRSAHTSSWVGSFIPLGYLTLVCSLLLLWRMSWLDLLGTWNLTSRLRTGFALCLIPVIGMLVFASASWLQLQRTNEQVEIRRFLTTHLDHLNQTIHFFIDKFAQVLSHRS